MPEAVVGLGDPLRDPLMRQMALDAGRGVPMTALEPPIVLRVHDVAVHARTWVGGQIRVALRVDERECTDSGGDPEQAGEHNDEARSLPAFQHARYRTWPVRAGAIRPRSGPRRVCDRRRTAAEAMRDGHASRTAEHNALFRALESDLPESRRLCTDPLARSFLTWPYAIATWVARVPGLRELVSRFIDNR